MSEEWESVSGAKGTFIGWGTLPGQYVQGEVISFDAEGGTDPNGLRVPEIAINLTEEAASFRKGERTNIEPGTLVQVTASQKSLKRDLVQARVNPGDLIRIELIKLVQTAKSPAKVFDVKVKRNSEPAPVVASTTPSVPQQESFASTAPF